MHFSNRVYTLDHGTNLQQPCTLCSGSEAGSFWRLIDSCITQLKVEGSWGACNESEEEEEVYKSLYDQTTLVSNAIY